MDREAWRAAVHGVTKSRTGLSELKGQRKQRLIDICYYKVHVFVDEGNVEMYCVR